MESLKKMPILNQMLSDYKRGWRQNLPSVTARTIDTINEVYSFDPRILFVLLLLLDSGPSQSGGTNCHTRLCHSFAFRNYYKSPHIVSLENEGLVQWSLGG